jgi:transcriptional regulator with XRE-family HTH domain
VAQCQGSWLRCRTLTTWRTMTHSDGMTQEPIGPTRVDVLIGEHVHVAMWRAGITQRQLAAALRVDQGSVSKRLRGRTPWRVSEVFTAAQLCGVDMSELMPTRDELGHAGSLTRGNVAAEFRCTPARANRTPLDRAAQTWGRASVIDGDGVAA